MQILISNFCAYWVPGRFELIAVAVVAMLIFGKQVPKIAREIGKAFGLYKTGIEEVNKTKSEFIDGIEKRRLMKSKIPPV